MSDKVKKQASSLSFSLSRWFSKISTMKPSTTILTIVTISGAMLLFGGLVYDIVNAPISSAYANNKFYFLYPGLSEQFIFDTVISVTLYALGFIGLLAVYQSSKHAYNPRQAYMTLSIAATLVLLTYIFLEYFIRLKLSGV
ncbi:MAG: hypothetical protein WC325_11270 [Candidatus Bathyarchaeia archaeon]|jgi:uncharacterized membrane protein